VSLAGAATVAVLNLMSAPSKDAVTRSSTFSNKEFMTQKTQYSVVFYGYLSLLKDTEVDVLSISKHGLAVEQLKGCKSS